MIFKQFDQFPLIISTLAAHIILEAFNLVNQKIEAFKNQKKKALGEGIEVRKIIQEIQKYGLSVSLFF